MLISMLNHDELAAMSDRDVLLIAGCLTEAEIEKYPQAVQARILQAREGLHA